jgi:hypothetical protein
LSGDGGAGLHLRRIKPLGTFHARSTRAAAAHARDGQVYALVNELGSGPTGQQDEVDVLLGDGVWMLASREDVTPFTGSER